MSYYDMNIVTRLLMVVFIVFSSACNQPNKQSSEFSKISFGDELYIYSKSKKDYFPGALLVANDKGELSVNSCKQYLKSITSHKVVETDENMHMLLYYLPCVQTALQKQAKDSRSGLYEGSLSKVIIDELDLSSFRSSLRRKLDENTNTFGVLNYKYSQSNNRVTVKRSSWEYDFILLGRGDYDRDGFEDLMILFVDQALSSTYYSSNLLVLRKKDINLLWKASDALDLLEVQ